MDFAGFETLSFERQGKILIVRIDRGENLNAVNATMHHEFGRVFRELNADPDSEVIVLTGRDKSFCAGGDIEWFQKMIDDPARFEALAPEGKNIVLDLLNLEKPIICQLNGPAAGLGATIALLCDIIIAAEDAIIGDPHVRMGLVAGDGGALIWPQLVGFARAKEYLMTGKMLSAQEAERIGLINHVVPAEELDAAVMKLAGQLANGATQAIRWTKTVTNIALKELAHKVMDAGIAYEMATNTSYDHQEAVTAFAERRKPDFKGR